MDETVVCSTGLSVPRVVQSNAQPFTLKIVPEMIEDEAQLQLLCPAVLRGTVSNAGQILGDFHIGALRKGVPPAQIAEAEINVIFVQEGLQLRSVTLEEGTFQFLEHDLSGLWLSVITTCPQKLRYPIWAFHAVTQT